MQEINSGKVISVSEQFSNGNCTDDLDLLIKWRKHKPESVLNYRIGKFE